MFNVEDKIKARVVRPEGDVVLSLRFPTDQEWIDRSLRRKYRELNLGRGKTQTVQQSPDQKDAELVMDLQEENPIDIEAREASRILERLSITSEPEEVQREGVIFVIAFKARGIRLVHKLRPPTEAERAAFAEMSPPVVTQGAISTYGFNIGAAGDLYNKVVKESSGYVGAVPIVHKAAAISAMMAKIADIEADEDFL